MLSVQNPLLSFNHRLDTKIENILEEIIGWEWKREIFKGEIYLKEKVGRVTLQFDFIPPRIRTSLQRICVTKGKSEPYQNRQLEGS